MQTRPRAAPHPLLSTTLGNLFACFREYGWPDARFALRTASLLGICAARTPLHHLERMRVRRQVEAQSFVAPPVFIIGHWRSGTTHLHQLLSQDPQFAVVTLMQAAFPLDFLTSIGEPIVAALLPETRIVDAIPISIHSPWEEEMAMSCFGTLSFFHAFFFPSRASQIYQRAVHFDGVTADQVAAWWKAYRYYLTKVQCVNPTRRLLLKNPANSARVAALRDQFPGAKFILIHRHPDEVYASTLLLHRKAREAWALQNSDGAALPQMVLENYACLMNACFTQTRGLQEDELVEIPMSDLESKPLLVLESVYQQLQLPGFESARFHFAGYLDKLGAFQKNQLSLSSTERAALRVQLRHVFERWNYE
jgi:hypothetical protein